MALVVLGMFGITQTDFGRDQVRNFLVSTLKSKVHGKLYVGKITDGFFTGVTIDSLEIRDAQDSLFLSTGRVTVHYDPRDVLDRRILLRNVSAEHPVVYLRQHEDGEWNFRRIFPSSKPQPFETPHPAAFIVIDSATVRDAMFKLTLPWHPSPHLRGTARDSAIRYELGRKDIEIRRTSEGFSRTWRWTHGDLTVLHGRVSHPDTAGMAFQFANVVVNESDPPFIFRDATGTLRQLGDSIWVDVSHFALPRSTGSGGGKVVWGSDLPVRYDIRVHSDSVAINDVAWVYPTLPRTGGGRTDLHIQTDPKNLHLTNFVLTNMDVRSTRSHLMGAMTFTIGTDTLIVKDVALTAAPVNFDLLRTLNGKPFPYDWQGDITGTVRASGGNLGRFRVESARMHFADANVPGAYADATGHGELDIFAPAFTAFHDFSVNVATLDLRTLQFLNKNFPRLNGTVSGSTVLDSVWTDVRFSNADLIHRDGPGPESHVTGSGRVTWGELYLTYDLDLQAQPLAFETLRKSYVNLPLRASLSGPIRVLGQSPDLQLTTTLSGEGGTLAYDGRVDADPPVYGAHGTGSVTSADLQTLLANAALPHTSLSGTYALDVTGDSLPDFVGSATADLQESRIGSATLAPSIARVHFGGGLVTIDTLIAHTAGARAEASGVVATAGDRTSDLTYHVDLSSVQELDRLLGRTGESTIHGPVSVTGTITGPLSALQTSGTLAAHDLAVGATRVRRVTGTYAFDHLSAQADGTLTLRADSIGTPLLPFEQATLAMRVAGGNHAAFRAEFAGTGAVRGTAVGTVTHDTTGVTTLVVDSARVATDSLDAYVLSAPMRVVNDARGITLDSLVLARSRGGVIALRNAGMIGDSLRGSLRTRDFSLGFLELFGSAVTDLRGALAANVDLSGTTAHPRLIGSVTVDSGSARLTAAGVRVDRLDADIGLDGDTLVIRKLTAVTNRERRGTLDVGGTVSFAQYDRPVFALTATARNFRAVDRRGLATLDVTTPTPITLHGPYTGAVVSGAIRVDRGTVYIPEVVRKRVVDLNDPELLDVVDTTVASNRAILPAPPSDFTRNLQLENVAINIGDDVWLRSDEANIKLGGSLNVTLGRNPITGERSQLALEGQLNAERGTYRLDVVPFVQPTFDVEQGTLRFFGTPDLDPALDITAINTVRRPRQSVNGQDIRIRATIGGTLSAPSLALASADNLPLSQSDLLSYLITGEPAFTLDYTTAQYINQLANVAVRSAGNILTSAIPRSVFDVVELQTPSALTPEQAQTGTENVTFYNNLLKTRALVGKQLNRNLFLNFSTGFCSESYRSATTFRNNLGVQLEYRLGRTYTAQFGIEPGTTDLLCSRSGTVQTILQTPPQLGIDFLRSWRF